MSKFDLGMDNHPTVIGKPRDDLDPMDPAAYSDTPRYSLAFLAVCLAFVCLVLLSKLYPSFTLLLFTEALGLQVSTDVVKPRQESTPRLMGPCSR